MVYSSHYLRSALENNHFLSPAKRQEVLAYFEEPGEYKIISEAWTGAGLRAGGWVWPNIELGIKC